MKTTSKWAVTVLAVAAGFTLAGSGAAGAAGAAGTAAPSPLGPAPSTLRPAIHPSEPGRFYAVAVTSGNAWAVGLQPSNSLIMHLSRIRGVYKWRVSFTKPVGYFLGVAATSPGNAWAVGGTNWFSPTQTLAEHWNGKTWTRVPTPTPDGSAYFNAVAATSASNAWAVGLITPGGPGVPALTTPLIEHWNGKAWTVAKFPEPADGGQFNGVAATSASNVWAVGSTGANSIAAGQTTLIEHWNGKSWTRVPSPSPKGTGTGSVLAGVAATGPDNAWADGETPNSGPAKSLIEHWNGTRWAVLPSPNPTGDTYLTGIAAASSTDAWAVGYTNPTTCSPNCGTAAFHWNGKKWAVTQSIDPPGSYLDVLEGVVIISSDNAWAVGTYNGWSSTLIEHWNGKSWIWHLPD